MACSLIERHGNGELRWGQEYRNNHLDPSEKSMLSYTHGMAVAKLVMSEVYDVPWASHVSLAGALSPSVRVIAGSSREEPDLIGVDSQGRWVVAEAKGRKTVTPSLRAKVRDQLNNVTGIQITHSSGNSQSHPVYARIGSILRTGESRFAIDLIDPVGPEEYDFNPDVWRKLVLKERINQLSMLPLSDTDENADSVVRQINNTLRDAQANNVLYLVNDDIDDAGDKVETKRQIIEQLESEFVVETMPDGTHFLQLHAV